jgi:type II secretory pathway component GspD/PulD (secretin)
LRCRILEFLNLAGIAFACLVGAGPARAQIGQAYAYITDVKSTQLSNAVRVTMEADGIIQVQPDNALFEQFLQPSGSSGVFSFKKVHQFRFRLSNCRSRVGSFKPVGMYPIDHLEFAVPVDAVNGVGLEVTVVLDTDASPVTILDFFRSSGGEGPSISVVEGSDQRSLSITVTSDLFPERRPEHKTAAEVVGAQRLDVRAHGDRVDILAANEPLSAIARELTARTGLPIAVQGQADRLVSTVLHDTRPLDAMALLADIYGLELVVENQAFLVVSGEAEDAGSAAVTSIPLNYLDAGRAPFLLPTFLLHYMHADPTRNTIAVSGSPALRARVAHDLAALDQPIPQCSISAAFVTYTKTADFTRTLEAARRTANSQIRVGAGSLGAPTGLIIYEKPGLGSPGIDAMLTALAQSSDLKVDARPAIQAVNGQSGQISSVESHFVVLNSQSFGSGGLQNIDTGTTLTVTPELGGADWITLHLLLQSSDVELFDPVTGLPTVETRNVQDSIRIRNGETVYLGGLSETLHQVTRFKIPILGDIPVIGALFRGRRTHVENQQVAVFITARLVPERTNL